MDARIVGWGHTPFGRLEDSNLEDLIVQAASEAIAHAGIDPAEVDGIWLGHFNAGLVDDGFASSLVLHADERLRFKPATRCENACASGSAAIFSARQAIRAGDARIALVIGVEKMTNRSTEDVTTALARASYQGDEAGVSFPEIFARIARTYFEANGDHSEILARIAAKNHANALSNPLAHLKRADYDFDFCNTISNKNPYIAEPLRLTDCSLISDGAAAIVLAADDAAATMPHNIRFRGAVHVNDYLPMSRRNMLDFDGPRMAIGQAYEQAGVTTSDLDFAEVHDCFTIAELMIYEALGLTEKGDGARAVREGTVYRDGALPVNLSGGLKSKGHPVGATGVSMHVLASQQLTGTAGAMQKEGAELGLVFNMGGSAVANYCSILENAGGSS